uniref:C2H2-type domain-containing protein n=1 Tax=Naja naja TaxID=35670 RepID=A0A8C6XLD2_NAJNA
MAEGDAALSSEPPVGQEEQPYKCKQCSRSYRHAGSLVNHCHTHEVGLFHCLLCHKDFSNPISLKSHLRTHTEQKRYKCPDCGRSFRVSSQLPSRHCPAQASQTQEEEGQSDGSYSFQRGQGTSSPVVDSCSGMEGSSGSLLSNLKKYIAESVVPADFSQQQFPIKTEGEKQDPLPGHEADGEEPGLLASLEDKRRYKRNQCDKAYKHAGSLTNHKQSHTLGVYQCLCGKSYRHSGSLINHKQTHQMGDFSCSLCSKHFQNVASLKSHLRGHQSILEKDATANGWQSQSQVSSLLRDDSEGLPYLCEQCGLGFDQAKNLIDHRQTHQAGIYQCSLCPKEYPTLLALKHHFHGHEQPFLCSLCGMFFPSEETLQHHHSLLHEEGEGQSDSPDVLKRETEEQLDGTRDPEEEAPLTHLWCVDRHLMIWPAWKSTSLLQKGGYLALMRG